MKTSILQSLLATSILLFGASTASAAPLIFFGEDLSPGGTVPAGGNAETARNNFLSSLVGVGNEDFESFANLTPLTGGGINLSFPGSSGAITANLSGDDGGICDQTVGGTVATITCGFDRFATSGNNYLQNASNMTLAFSDPVSAFGFYGTDFGDFEGQVSLNFTGGLNQAFNVNSTQGTSAGGNVLFWGVIDPTNTFNSIAFSTTSGADVFGFDDMVIGDQRQVTNAPEPGALALFGLGLLGLALRRKAAR